jgi:hypothetical protein
MFSDLRATLRDLLTSGGGPDRRDRLAAMKQALVHARLAVEDLQAAAAQTRGRLAAEEADAATARRRRELAAGIGDAETVAVADRYLAQVAERTAVLARKLEAQEAEAALAAREVDEMVTQFKAAAAGVGDAPTVTTGPSATDLGLPDDAALTADLDVLGQRARRAEQESAADAKLAELKRRMGR